MEITDRALELVAAVVDRAEGSEDAAVRIVPRSEGWGIELDQPRPEDETFEYEERTVLIVDADVAETLLDSTLDVQDTPNGLRLTLR